MDNKTVDIEFELDNKIKSCDPFYLLILLNSMMQQTEEYPETEEIIRNNYLYIIKTVPKEQLSEAISFFVNINGIESKVKDNFEFLINNTLGQDIPKVLATLKEMGLITEIIDNFDLIYKKCGDTCLNLLIGETKGIAQIETYIFEKFDNILDRTPPYLTNYLVDNLKDIEILQKKLEENFRNIILKCSDIPRLIRDFGQIIGAEAIRNELDLILQRCGRHQIINLINNINLIQDGRGVLEEKKEKIEPLIIESCTEISRERLEKEEIYDFVRIILNEISENEDKAILDIKPVGMGQFSRVYQIGEKIIKFGQERNTEQIPYHRRILQPILRRPVYNKERSDRLFYIEISENVLNNKQIEITDEDVYQVYKEFRDAGLIWTDVKVENLGRLKKPNSVHMKNFDKVDEQSIGITRKNTEREELPAGELVVIDTDHIYRIQDVKMPKVKDVYKCSKYELRYEKEKRQENFREYL